MPKVSVITPAYNAAPFLEETVKSVQAQTFIDWEMIIVDDCSIDKTYQITWQEILAKGFVGYRLNKVLSLYREGNTSLTSGKQKAAKQQWRTYRDYYNFSVIRSAFYFSQYAFHAVKKHFF